jgi:hypothetical protein
MKRNLSRIMLLVAVALVFGPAANAQEINVHAKIPFNFVVSDRLYPAGEYAIQTAAASTYFLSIKNEGGTVLGLVPSHPCISTKPASPANQAKLVFHKVRETYFLFRVWLGDSTEGRQFSRSHAEAELALNGAKTHTVIVAASIIH